MKKFRFTMQAVLDVRKSQREAKEMELAQARSALAAEEAKLAEIEKAVAAVLSDNLEDVSAGYFILRERYLKRLRDSRKLQQRKVNEAIASVEVAVSRLKDAIVEQKKMERARERQREDWSVDFKRDEQKINDETASARAHMRILAGSYE